MFPRDCCCVQSLLATIQFQLLYIHTSCPGDAWHSRGATHWSLPLVQEVSVAVSSSMNSWHTSHYLSWYPDEGHCGGAANTAILTNISADCIATEIKIPSRMLNNVSNTLDSVRILMNGDPLSSNPKQYLHLSLDRGGLEPVWRPRCHVGHHQKMRIHSRGFSWILIAAMVPSGVIFDAACNLGRVRRPCQISCRMRNDSRVVSHPFFSHSRLCDSWTYWTLVLYNLDNIAVILSNSCHVQNLSYSTMESELHLSIKSSHWQGSKCLSHLFIVAASTATLSSCMTSISHSCWYIPRMSVILSKPLSSSIPRL